MRIPSNDTVITILPLPTVKDLVRQEMRIQRNPDFEERIATVFNTFLLVFWAGMATYYLSLED